MKAYERMNNGRNVSMMAIALIVIASVVIAATPAEADDPEYLAESEFTTLSGELEDEGKYYISEEKSITMVNGVNATIFLLKDVSLTITGSGKGETGSITVYIVPTAPEVEAETLSYDSRSTLKYDNGANSATITGVVSEDASHYICDSNDTLTISDDTPMISVVDSTDAEDNDRMYTIGQIDAGSIVISASESVALPHVNDAEGLAPYTVSVKDAESATKAVTFTGPFTGESPTMDGTFAIKTTDVEGGSITVTAGAATITGGIDLFENGYAILDANGKGSVHAIGVSESTANDKDVLFVLPNTTLGSDVTITGKNKFVSGFSTTDGLTVTYNATAATIASTSKWTGTIESSLDTVLEGGSTIGDLKVTVKDKNVTLKTGTVTFAGTITMHADGGQLIIGTEQVITILASAVMPNIYTAPSANTEKYIDLSNIELANDGSITIEGNDTACGVSGSYSGTISFGDEIKTVTFGTGTFGTVDGSDLSIVTSDGTVFTSAVECKNIIINGEVEFQAGLTTETLTVGTDGSIVKGTTVTINNSDGLGFTQGVTFETTVTMGALAQSTDKSIVFAKDVTISGTSTISNGTVTIPKGVTMTIDDDGELTVKSNGTLVVIGKITGGTLDIADDGTVMIPEANSTQGIKAHISSTFDDEVEQASTEFDDFDELKDAYDDGYRFFIYTGNSNLAINEDFTLWEDSKLVMNGKDILVSADVSMINKGIITTNIDGTQLIIGQEEGESASFVNAGTITALDETDDRDQFITIVLINGESKSNFTNDGIIDRAAIQTGVNTSFINNGIIMICTDGTQLDGYFENTEDATMAFADNISVTIGNGTDKATFDNDGKLKLGETDEKQFSISKESVMNNTGSINSISDDIKVCAITGEGTFNNETDGSVGIAINTAEISGITYTEKIQGDYTQKKTYMSIQHVEVTENTRLQLMPDSRMIIQGTLTVNGDLIVRGTLIIAAGDSVAAAAQLVVNGKITIEEGGEMIISNPDGNGTALIDEGSAISVENGGMLTLGDDSELRVNGTLDLYEGSILKTPTSRSSERDGLVIGATGVATFSGYFHGSALISIEGYIILDNGDNDVKEAPDAGTVNIALSADGAELIVDSYLFLGDLVITDEGLVTYEYTDDSSEDLSIPGYNDDSIRFSFTEKDDEIEYCVLNGGFRIKETAVSKSITDNKDPFDGNDQRRTQTYSMDLSGTVSVTIDYDGDTPKSPTSYVTVTLDGAVNDKESNGNGYVTKDDDKVILNKGGITVNDSLSLDDQVRTVLEGTVDIGGTMDVVSTDAIVNNGTLTVTGLLSSASTIDNDGEVHAALYTIITGTGSSKVTTYNYSTLDVAIEAVLVEGNTADKRVTIIGDAKVKQSVDVPSTVTIVFSSKEDTLTIGSTDDPEVFMTFLAGSDMTSSAEQVIVFGTLLFENKENDGTKTTVSDVTMESEEKTGFRTYTNIHSAIAQASASEEGATVTVTKAPLDSENRKQYVTLGKNLTIPSNVTLVVGDEQHSAALKLMNGVTLTIDGVLQTGQAIMVENRLANKAMNVDAEGVDKDKLSSAIVVKGVLMMSEPMTYGGSFPVFGAYFVTDKWQVVSNLGYAMTEIDSIENGAITINGPVDAGEVTFVAGETANTIVVSDTVITAIDNGKQIVSSLDVTSMTLGDGTKVSTGSLSKGTVSGTFGTDNGAIDLHKVSGTSFTIGNDEGDLILHGTVKTVEDSGFSVVSGEIYLGSDSAFTFDGTRTAENGDKLTYDLWVFMTIAPGATAVVTGNSDVDLLYVEGAVEVPAGEILITEFCVVHGIIAVAEPTDTTTYGTFEVSELFIGIEINDLNVNTGDNASVTGPVDAEVIIIASGCGIDVENLEGMRSTEFYIDDAEWFSAHSEDAETIEVDTAPVENAILSCWSDNSTGDKLVDKDGDAIFEIDIGKYDRLDADIKTDIYEIILLADEGIADVTIDGRLMEKGFFGTTVGGLVESYRSMVTAGTHTIKYTLQNGWSGNAVLTVDGKTQSGMTFSTEGTPVGSDVITYDLQLSGIEKSGYMDGTGAGTPSTDDGDSGITDYLLIVLIVVVVFLAGIVAMRLLRS